MDETTKILWVGKSDISVDQLKSLSGHFNCDIEVKHVNIPWQLSKDKHDDVMVNKRLWEELLKQRSEHGFRIVGIFPPVAIEAMPTILDLDVLIPGSRCNQHPVRWIEVNKWVMEF